MLVDMGDMLRHAYGNGCAVGAFNLVSLDFIEAILAGAEAQSAPVILSLAQSHYGFFDPDLPMPAVRAAAQRAAVAVAIHLDHGSSIDAASRGIGQGFNGVLVDASTASLEENIARTRSVVEMAHGCGIPVEGELGSVAGVEGEDAERHPGHAVYTSPDEAERYVRETGVDFLARLHRHCPWSHAGRAQARRRAARRDRSAPAHPAGHPRRYRTRRPAVAPSDRAWGRQDRLLHRLGRCGGLRHSGQWADPRGPLLHRSRQGCAGCHSGRGGALHCALGRGGAGRADQFLAACRPWQEAEHLIVYHVAGGDPRAGASMVAEGGRVLADIPGVRQVVAGTAVREDAAYRFCWLIRVAHQAAIDRCREHPDHLAFADGLFRPLAADRISIDFLHAP